MDLASISHRSAFTDCHAVNDSEIIVSLRTGKDVTTVSLIHADPYAGGAMGYSPWQGQPEAMVPQWELAHNRIWSIRLRPRYKREQYYFSISDGKQTLLMFEDGFYTQEQAEKDGRLKQYYKFPWLNPGDVIAPPAWVNDTVWYQIMPDRFCKAGDHPRRFPLRKWDGARTIHFWDTFGGDLKGITEKLPYLRDLGINGIYMTPIFLSDTNHKYNTFSYDRIDPDFGTEEDLIELVDTAHALGIRVMLDAVFNHSGTKFEPWQDVVKNGPASPYWDWFFVNQWPLPILPGKTEDGRYYSFAFAAYMPKLNTSNPEVIEYFLQRCRHWVTDWHIDGIRFDVGNEVSHKFLKALNQGLKAVNPEVFLLGEIWHDSIQWIQGDEYDSVMNYPFLDSLHNFYLDGRTARELMYDMNRVLTLYPQQVSEILFNFLDTHDTARALTRCGSKDIFYQQLTFLLTMPGSACIYYGTEIALPGGPDPDCRRPMPWKNIESGKCDSDLKAVSTLISLRRQYPQLRRGIVAWKLFPDAPHYVCFGRYLKGSSELLAICLNAGETDVSLPEGKVLFSRNYRGGHLQPGGCAIVLTEVGRWNS